MTSARRHMPLAVLTAACLLVAGSGLFAWLLAELAERIGWWPALGCWAALSLLLGLAWGPALTVLRTHRGD